MRQYHVIYEAPKNSDDVNDESTPPIIVELNKNLQNSAPEGMKDFSVEWIAERVGISRKILYEWTENDPEFTEALEQLKDVQENDPFKTGTEEDAFVNSMTIALLLLETRERHYKSQNA